jgi:hypothetical protein
LQIARAAESQGHTKKVQASALTKFSWFSKPACWTVYDRFVAQAMNVRGNNAEEKLVRFYNALEERGFLDLAMTIQDELDKWPMMPLFGARVLDKLMMLSGARRSQANWADNFILGAKSFLEILPSEWRQPVEHLAGQIKGIDCRDFLRD